MLGRVPTLLARKFTSALRVWRAVSDIRASLRASGAVFRFGLTAYVCSREMACAFRSGEALELRINGLDTGAVSHRVSPFGGVKASGFGREGAQRGIEEYLETKTFHFTELADPRYRLPGLGRRDLVPAAGPI
jgi:acyl-CoA reductase-like NAD-dependent aldehyde dehydrogenase